MSNATPLPGWYPDPSGAGGLRWWDGDAWTRDVRPPLPPGTAAHGGDPWGADGSRRGTDPSGPRRRGPSAWVWVLVGVLTLALLGGGWLAAGLLAPTPGPSPTATAPTLPVPTDPAATNPPPTSTGAAASASPTPTTAPAPGSCPAQPPATVPLTSSDPLQVGDLALPVPDGWGGPVQDPRVPRARDAWQYYLQSDLGSGWGSSMTVGFLTGDPGAASPADDALALLTCLLDSDIYAGTNALLAESDTTDITLSNGSPAVRIDGTVAIDNPAIASTGSLVVVVTVDTTRGREFFFGTAPLEDADQVQAIMAGADALTLA